MEPILSLLSLNPAPLLPTSLLSWLGWLVFLGLLAWLAWSWRSYQAARDSRTWLIFVSLLVLCLFNLFIGVRLPSGTSMPQPGIPQETQGPTLMFLSALPWFLAGGILGPVAAAILGRTCNLRSTGLCRN